MGSVCDLSLSLSLSLSLCARVCFVCVSAATALLEGVVRGGWRALSTHPWVSRDPFAGSSAKHRIVTDRVVPYSRGPSYGGATHHSWPKLWWCDPSLTAQAMVVRPITHSP